MVAASTIYPVIPGLISGQFVSSRKGVVCKFGRTGLVGAVTGKCRPLSSTEQAISMDELYRFPCAIFVSNHGIVGQLDHILSEFDEFRAEVRCGNTYEALMELMDLYHSIETAQRILQAKYSSGSVSVLGLRPDLENQHNLLNTLGEMLQRLAYFVAQPPVEDISLRLGLLRQCVWDNLQNLARVQGIDLETIRKDVEFKNRVRGYYAGLVVETGPPIRGTQIQKSGSHDAGAYARCSYCGRYSDKQAALLKYDYPCDCGKLHGWSGSFIKPTAESIWSEA